MRVSWSMRLAFRKLVFMDSPPSTRMLRMFKSQSFWSKLSKLIWLVEFFSQGRTWVFLGRIVPCGGDIVEAKMFCPGSLKILSLGCLSALSSLSKIIRVGFGPVE